MLRFGRFAEGHGEAIILVYQEMQLLSDLVEFQSFCFGRLAQKSRDGNHFLWIGNWNKADGLLRQDIYEKTS